MNASTLIHQAAAATMATGLLAAGAITMAGPAQAAGTATAASSTHCKTTTKTFDLPGKPDVKVSANICIKYTGSSGGYRHYKAWLHKVSWKGTQWFIGGNRFDDFSVFMRAEHGSKRVTTCGFLCQVHNVASKINNKESGSATFPSTGDEVVHVQTKAKRWTADAGVSVNTDGDGKGPRNWNLAGTAAVS